MKISFLIPSKDRLDLLKHAVDSIRDQSDLDYEIVIVDNASERSYAGFVRELDDARIVFKRQETPISVTANWQDSLDLATGDYILMLGDDDALAPGFAGAVKDYISEDGPDVIYLAAYHYCYPRVMSDQDSGYLASVLNSEFLEAGGQAFHLPHDYAVELANAVLEFRHRIGLNAQHYLLKASFASGFARFGGLYQSPYPDTFSSVAVLLHAQTILVLPKELVIIGISPKSFGAYYFSGRHDEGYVFLDNLQVTPDIREALEAEILPGDRNDTNWLIAAEAVRQCFPALLRSAVDVGRYRALQMVAVLRTGAIGGTSSPALDDLRSRLSPRERPIFDALEAAVRSADESARGRLLSNISQALGQYHPAKVNFIDIGPHADISDALAFLKSGVTKAAHAISAPQPHLAGPAAEPQEGLAVGAPAYIERVNAALRALAGKVRRAL